MASTLFTVPMATTLSSSIHLLKLHTPFSFPFRSLRSPTPTFFTRKFSTLAVATSPSQPATVSDSDRQDRIVLPTNESSNTLLRIRHTCAHVMAMAVQKLYPQAKVTIGPWIENGFYYDFDMEPLTDKDLKRIKKEMDRIISKNLPLVREEVSRDEAHRRILALNEPYKMEILEGIKEEPITIYHIGGEWWDLCAGPHVESTGNIKRNAVELESIAGAYWRGDEKKPMLQRIYGTAWETEEQLKAYLHFKEEAKRRDHRRLGQDLDLFSLQEDAGGGLVFWHPKGAIVRHIIEDFWKKVHIERGYDLLYTPHVAKADLWKISGHLDFYKENMYDQMSIEDEHYQLRPMNCPYHILVYKRKRHSYRDFPVRVAELGTVYRYELSGSLHGLFRVRGFTQDDAHIFCLEDQIKDEIRGVLDLTEETLSQFGFDKYEINLSTRPEKSVGEDDIWEKATSALKDALDDKGWTYQIDDGGGAFYGPKIDVKIEDALGRKWQCSTIQVDFNLPQRFDITYIDSNSEKKRPIMIHRAVLGSLERFFGVLIEHYAGDFPLWLSPIQARILPVTDAQLEYCKDVTNKLKKYGIRAEVCHGERLPKLIRNAEKQKIPLMAVVGAKMALSSSITSVHITALDAITNVNSLFTLGVFIGLSFNPNDPSNTLNTDPSCVPTTAIAENLVAFHVYSFSSFLFSSLIALALKQTIRLSRTSSHVAHVNGSVLRVGMLVSGIGSVLGCAFLMLALVNVVQIKLGTVACGSQHALAAIVPLFVFVPISLCVYVTVVVYAFTR